MATIAIRNKESLCALRPHDSTLLLETLHYPDEVREREFKLTSTAVNDRELAVVQRPTGRTEVVVQRLLHQRVRELEVPDADLADQ